MYTILRVINATSSRLLARSLTICCPLECEVLHIRNEGYCILTVIRWGNCEVRVGLLVCDLIESFRNWNESWKGCSPKAL